jgi:glutathione S-transferase
MPGDELNAPAILITVPLSHFCEKARWALDRSGVAYREEPHAPLLNRLATRRGAGGTVPVLIHGDRRLIDSTEILVYVDQLRGGDWLYPLDPAARSEVDAWEERFDAELGPHARRWIYAQLLPDARLLRSLWSRGVPAMQARLVPLIAPLARYLVRKGYKVTAESAKRSYDRLRAVFSAVDDKLADGRDYLVAQRFSAADLTFASLAAPLLLPIECRATQPSLNDLPEAMRAEVLRLRDTRAGRFALRMFAQERAAAAVN